MLNGRASSGLAKTLGVDDIGAVLERVEARFRGPSRIIFLPYLAGERTPHNDPDARGAFFGLDYSTDAEDLVQAVLEGAAFMLMDAQLALKAAGRSVAPVAVIGGGARSRFWLKLIASAIGLPVLRSRRLGQGAGLRRRPARPPGADRRKRRRRSASSRPSSRRSRPTRICMRPMASASASTSRSIARSRKLAQPRRIGARPRRR